MKVFTTINEIVECADVHRCPLKAQRLQSVCNFSIMKLIDKSMKIVCTRTIFVITRKLSLKPGQSSNAAANGEQDLAAIKVPKCRESASSGSWLARDNTTNFINWCREVGIKSECLFESEGLGMTRSALCLPRSYVNRLLQKKSSKTCCHSLFV